MGEHNWDRMLICRKCGQGLNAGDLMYGERPCGGGVADGQTGKGASMRDDIADEIAGFQIGSGYYGTSIATQEAREIADLILAHFNVAPREAS